jgi:hypothetical protein
MSTQQQLGPLEEAGFEPNRLSSGYLAGAIPA